jgi:hypothetical protein
MIETAKMTSYEFKIVLGNHLKKFPQLAKESIDKDSWWDALKPFTKEQVESASSLMFNGHIKRPFYASDHVAAIVNYCLSCDNPNSKFNTAKEAGAGDCCNQTGIRKIYHPQDIMRLLIHRFPDKYDDRIKSKHGSRDQIEVRHTSVACDCELGYARFPRKGPNPWPHIGDRYWHIEVGSLSCDEIVEEFLRKENLKVNPLGF